MQEREKLEAINSVLKQRKSITRRGRYPRLLLKSIEILAPCRGYDNGITIKDFTRKLYGKIDTDHKIKARQQISKLRERWEIYIYSVKPMGDSGAERRYCHLQDKDEFQAVIKEYAGRRDGNEVGRQIVQDGKRKTVKIRELERAVTA